MRVLWPRGDIDAVEGIALAISKVGAKLHMAAGRQLTTSILEIEEEKVKTFFVRT